MAVCCGNYYLCKVKHRCDDQLECHALARAVVGAEDGKRKRCLVVSDGYGFHYEFETLPRYDFTRAIRRLINRSKAWKRRSTK